MIETIGVITVVGLLAMMSPGPDLILIMRNASVYNRRAALATAIGITLGVAVHVSYCIVGIGLIISQSVLLFSLIKYAGAAYLLYIGAVSLFSRNTSELAQASADAISDASALQGFKEGFICNLLNPKATLFFLSVFTQLINPQESVLTQSVYGFVLVLWSLVYWSLLVLVIQRPLVQNFFERMKQGVERVFGAILVGLGLHVALSD